MKLPLFLGFLLFGLACAAPSSKDDILTITDEFFPDKLKIYEGEHDIVKIYVPLNNLNFDENSSGSDSNEDKSDDGTLFFVQADISDGKYVDKGLYMYKMKDRKVQKLLDSGRDITAPYDDSKIAYFAAVDGIYMYDDSEKKVVKYGSVDDDLVGIAYSNATGAIYALGADKNVYKITEDGNKKEKVAEIRNAEQIVLDFADNLFYADSDKNVFVVNVNGVKKIEGLPESDKITLIRPPFVLEEGIPVVAGKKSYTVFPNGTVEYAEIDIDTKITASSVEGAVLQYYAHDKKIYEYNVLEILLGSILDELRNFLDDRKDSIQEISTRSRSQFRA